MGSYRLNAGIVVFRADGKVLFCQRLENYKKNWQFPQGGIDKGETPLQAAVRELKEETSLASVKFVRALSRSIRYDYPEDVKQKQAMRGIFDNGQEQYWHLFFLTGDEAEINLQTKKPEFKNYQWIDIKETPQMVVDFKKDVYKHVAREFDRVIRDYLA